jgi:hypothetical protein
MYNSKSPVVTFSFEGLKDLIVRWPGVVILLRELLSQGFAETRSISLLSWQGIRTRTWQIIAQLQYDFFLDWNRSSWLDWVLYWLAPVWLRNVFFNKFFKLFDQRFLLVLAFYRLSLSFTFW